MSSPRLPALLLLATASLASTLHGLDTFRPEPVTWTKAEDVSFTFGDTWVAYREGSTTVKMVDRTTGQVTRTFDKPIESMPVAGVSNQWRTVPAWGQIICRGNQLAICSGATIQDTPTGYSPNSRYVTTVYLWDLTTSAPPRILDIDLVATTPFTGLSATRLVMLDQAQRRFLQWDLATLAPLPTITVPAEFPAPVSTSVYTGPLPITLAGDIVAYRKDGLHEQLDLIAVNLATGVTSRLPLPARPIAGKIAMGGYNDGLLVTSFSSSNFSIPGKIDLLHYNLTTGTLVGDTSLDHLTGTANDVSVLVRPDGGWRVIASPSSFYGFHLVSGHDLKSTFDGHVAVPYLPQFSSGGFSGSTGVLGTTANELWFKPRSTELPGIRALKLPAGAAASTLIDATALPCAESDGVLKLKLTCSPAPIAPLSIRIRTKDGTATSASDFTAVDRIETVPAGQAETIVSIPVTQDTVIEPTEFFEVELSDAGPAAVLPVTRVTATIRATSLDLLTPAPTYQPVPAATPHRVYLANGTLLQFNSKLESSSSPKLARKPFDGGEWTPSPNWGRNVVSAQSAEFYGRSGNLALFREDGAYGSQQTEYALYDVPNDQVIFRVTPAGNYPAQKAAIGASRFFFDPGFSTAYREYDLAAPHTARTLARTIGSGTPAGVAYTRDFLAILNGTQIEKYSLADGSYQGTLLQSGPWTQTPAMTAEGDLLAIRSDGKLWVLSIDHPMEVKEVEPPAGGFGSSDSPFGFADGILYSAIQNGPTVHVIDPRNGVLLESITQDFIATAPEGWAGLSEYASFYMQSFSAEGKKAALLAYEGDNYNGTYRVIRLSREGNLPSLRNPEAILESDGPLTIQLAEAAPFPITVTTRTVTTVHNQQEDWSGNGTVTIPAGQTAIPTGLSVVDDHLPEGDRNVALEVTLTGNGHTEVRRLPLRVLDNDQIQLADVPHEERVYDNVFASVSGGWAYRSTSEGFSWSGNPDFYAATPYGQEATYQFPSNMAGSGEWLAVTHDTWGGNFDIKNPSSVLLYKPASGNKPVRILKGLKRDNYFGRALFARGTKLWVGAPGRYDKNGKKVIDVKGQAFEYDMTTGKRTRTFKPQKLYARGFGSQITANDGAVWFTSYDIVTKTGAVSQYSRSTGKWVRTLTDPSPGSEAPFGGQLEANADTVIATDSGEVRGYSTTTGALSWTITLPGTYPYSIIELVRDDLLAVFANGSLFFYHLVPGQQPVMLVEVLRYGWGASKLEVNGSKLMVARDGGSNAGEWTLVDLTGIPHLSAFYPSAPAPLGEALAPKVQEAPPENGITFAKTQGGWTMNFGSNVLLTPAQGTELTLESSTDLDEWETIAQRDAFAGWVPFVEWLSIGDGNSLKIQREDMTRYFRLRITPVKP